MGKGKNHKTKKVSWKMTTFKLLLKIVTHVKKVYVNITLVKAFLKKLVTNKTNSIR